MIFVQPVACILCLLSRIYGAHDTQGISRVTWSFSSVLNYPCIKHFTKKNSMYFQASCRCVTSFFLCILSCMLNFYTVHFMFPPERQKFPVNKCVNIKKFCHLFTVSLQYYLHFSFKFKIAMLLYLNSCCSSTYPPSYPVNTEGSFLGIKPTLVSIQC